MYTQVKLSPCCFQVQAQMSTNNCVNQFSVINPIVLFKCFGFIFKI